MEKEQKEVLKLDQHMGARDHNLQVKLSSILRPPVVVIQVLQQAQIQLLLRVQVWELQSLELEEAEEVVVEELGVVELEVVELGVVELEVVELNQPS